MHTRCSARTEHISVAVSAIAASILTVIAAAPLSAQTPPAPTWPTKRVQIVVPFAPGSATDLLPRTLFEHVSGKVGQPFIVENRPGGGGAMGVSVVAKAEPDGHTLLVHSNALVTSPAIQSMPYDPVQDFAGITPLGNVPLVLVISPGEEHQDAAGVRRLGEGESRIDQLRRRRDRNAAAPDHGAFPPDVRIRGPARSVQRRAGCADGSHHRARGRVLLLRSRRRCRSSRTASSWRWR